MLNKGAKCVAIFYLCCYVELVISTDYDYSSEPNSVEKQKILSSMIQESQCEVFSNVLMKMQETFAIALKGPSKDQIIHAIQDSIKDTIQVEIENAIRIETKRQSTICPNSPSHNSTTATGFHLDRKSNCDEWLKQGSNVSGVHDIYPKRTEHFNTTPVKVYCDMEDHSGGWTVIQRRGIDSTIKSENFNRSWVEYENGFGTVTADYWLGLRNIMLLTRGHDNELIITTSSKDGKADYSKYSTFRVSGNRDYYRLYISGFSGTGENGILLSHKMRFSTYDNDNDYDRHLNCAAISNGGWWFKSCGMNHTNETYYSFVKTEMKIRPIWAN